MSKKPDLNGNHFPINIFFPFFTHKQHYVGEKKINKSTNNFVLLQENINTLRGH